MRRAAAGLAWGALHACVPAIPAGTLATVPSCPRDAAPDATGRCACAPGLSRVLGACVGPAVASAYCGPAARPDLGGGCTFRSCAAGEALDLRGVCRPVASLVRTGPACAPASALVVDDDGRTACVSADAACPRGRVAQQDACVAPSGCPAGALPAGTVCRSLVTESAPGRPPVVDLGAWALLVLGPSGGTGSAQVCRPLQGRPGAFGLVPGQSVVATLSIQLSARNQDVSAVYAEVSLAVPTGPAGQAVPHAAQDAARDAVATLVEPLRGLGGQASAAQVSLQVRCAISSL